MSSSAKVKSKVVKIIKRRRSVEYQSDDEKQANKRTAMATTVVNFIGKIEPFTAGDNFKEYIERMEHIYQINKIEDEA